MAVWRTMSNEAVMMQHQFDGRRRPFRASPPHRFVKARDQPAAKAAGGFRCRRRQRSAARRAQALLVTTGVPASFSCWTMARIARRARGQQDAVNAAVHLRLQRVQLLARVVGAEDVEGDGVAGGGGDALCPCCWLGQAPRR